MIALSWLLWLFVIAIQAILHFCFIGRRSNNPNGSSNGNRFNQSKYQQEEEETEKQQRDPSSHDVQCQDHCNDCNEKEHTITIMRRKENIPSILKDNHGLKRRRIRSDVSLVSDESQMKPLIHSISSSTDGYDDDHYKEDDDCHKEHDHTSQDCESDSLDEEEEWRLALIQRYVKEHPSQESFVSINMLNRSLDSTDNPNEHDSSIGKNRDGIITNNSSSSSNSVPWVCT